eukprot:CAMPEP_0202014562 /NCGR_PEP_ID=MMETSP0905-20130828/29505_1 /ASSEMBLY_ACC=CAM_ASM_000554 /TAXON_ID=420261 /ORGANISM="Thalassiosira antarctica, Strain CCMP982" /LENGTH=339 /DNA_ID=CAMNT_0048574491 /DNA_START=129 /DNA_END=1144 /DNA_ORIENTATION=-
MGAEASSTAPPAPQPPAITIPPVPSQTYLHHTTLSPRPKVILIGDSITELGSSHAQGWVTSLAIRYNRRMDVVNRGMNGYNSRWGMAALPLILEEMLGPAAYSANDAVADESIEKESRPHQEQQTKNSDSNEECLNDEQTSSTIENQEPKHPQYTFLIGYGANDSCLPDGANSRHHVPLDEYSSNLKRMIQMIQTWNTEKNVAVAISTPPPCDTERQNKRRDNENVTKLYAEACIKVASEMGVPVVDLWRGMQLPIAKNNEEEYSSSFESKQQWKIDYLSDGLHLTPMGNYRLYELVVEVLDQSADAEDESFGLELSVSKLPRSYPDHSLVDAKDPGKT